MLTTIVCPGCGKSIEVTQALVDQISRHLASDLEEKYKKELEIERKRAEEQARKELEEKNALELADLKKQLEEKDEKVREMRKEELKLREEKRKVEEKEKELALEVVRRVDEEKKKLEETLLKELQESYRLKDLEKEKVIQDLKKSLEDAQRKAQQGSQQTQGEVAELEFESTLRSTFLTDTIMPVEKGVKGADVRHIVKTAIGNTCGVILWEVKRTKAWSAEWVMKLKDDLRAEKANIPVIVSAVLPDEAKSGFGLLDGVYVVSFSLAIPVAHLLRKKLIDIAREKFISQNREGSAEKLYEYVTSHEFRQQIEAIVEVYQDMQVQILKERASFEKIWKTREAQVQKLLSSTAGVVGALRGLIGQSLPVVKGLELIEDEEKKERLLE
jgi:hypothetical protein